MAAAQVYKNIIMELRDIIIVWLRNKQLKNSQFKKLTLDPIVSYGCSRIKYLNYYVAYIENDIVTLIPRNFKHLVINASDPKFFSKLARALKRRMIEMDELNNELN